MSESLFVPQIAGRYGIMAVEIAACAICKKTMVFGPSGQYLRQTFPSYQEMTFPEQIKRAGWEIASEVEVDGDHICKKCAGAGLAVFECAICKEKISSNMIEESFGDPPEFVCRKCYETVPAKIWNETVDALRNRHRYDFD